MKPEISDTLSRKPKPNVIRITTNLFQLIQSAHKEEWQSLFNEFRLNLQNRLVGSDKRELLKLQGKIEEVTEIEQFFDGLYHPKEIP